MKEVEENKNEKKQNREEIGFENAEMQAKDFSNGQVISSSIHFEQKGAQENAKTIQELNPINTGSKPEPAQTKTENFENAEKPVQIEIKKESQETKQILQNKKTERAEKIEKFEFEKRLANLKETLLEKWNSFHLFIADHFFLLFQSTRKNYERINGQDIDKIPASSAGRPASSASEKQGFDSFNNLERYQKKVRKITFSLSGAVAAALILALIVPYFFSSNSAEASAFIFSQSSWAGGATANTAAHPTNKTSWTEYASKDATTSAAAGGVSLTQTASQAITDNGNPPGSLTGIGSGSIAGGTNPTGTTISADGNSVYVTNYGSNTISMFSRNTGTGALTALSPATIATGTNPSGITISADGNSVYVTNYGSTNVSMYSRNTSTGALTALSPATIVAETNPNGINISADGTSVYVTNFGSTNVSLFSRNTSTGALAALSPLSLGWTGGGCAGIAISVDGTSAYIANSSGFFGSYYIYMFSRNTSPALGFGAGTLSSTMISGSGSSATVGLVQRGALIALSPATIATGNGPRGIDISADGTSVYVANRSSNTISMYSRNTSTGVLTALSPATIAAAGAMDVAISPDGTSVYVIGDGYPGVVSMYSRNPSTGALTALSPATIATGKSPQGIAISADGASVYVANQSTSPDNVVSMYSRNPSTGALTALSPGTIAAENPSDVTISPDDAFVYVSNSNWGRVSMYSRNTSTGALTSLGTVETNTSYLNNISISPDGTSVYTGTSNSSGALHTLTRNTSTGILTLLSSIVSSGFAGSIVSPDNFSVYVLNSGSGVVSMYSRNTSTGALTALSPATIAAGSSPNSINISDNGASVYVTNGSSNTVSMYSRSPGFSSGTFTSGVIDTGAATAFTTLSYSATLNGQTLTIDARSGNTATPDGSWTDWTTNIANGGSISALSGKQYIQYRANFSTSDTSVTPTLSSVTINYGGYNTSGTLTSSIYNSGNSANTITGMTWTDSGTSVTETVGFQVRSASTSGGIASAAWCGPADVSAPCAGTSYFTTSTGDAIPANSPLKTGGDDQYFQYKITLASSGFATPTVTNASVQYAYNVAPAISSVTYTQNSNGTVTVPYTLTETYDDLGNIAHGTAAAPIKALLFWQPDSGVTAPVLTDSQTGIITLTNTNSQPIPTSGSMLIDTELITFDSAGCTGNQRNILTRGATFDTAFPTTAASHSAGAAVFFNSSSAVQTINTFSATGTPGDNASTSGNSFVWDPRNDSNSNLNTNKLTGLLLKVVANDADATNFNTIGQSSVTAAQTLDLQLPTFTMQYYSDAGLTSSLGTNPKLKAGTYYIKISASEALASAPTISIAAEGTANDVTNAATTLVSGNDYTYTRTIASDAAAVGTTIENISITGTDNFSNVSTNVNPTDEATKAGYTDTNAPTFTMQYYSDSGLTNSLGTNPKLKAGTYYIKISANEALASAPTISIAAEGTANDVTNAATTLVSGNDYTYTRIVANDASAVGTTIENFSVTGTDNFSNVSTNVNPTDEATKAGYTDTVVPTSPGTATLNSYLNNTGNQTVSWTQVTEASFQDYLVQRKTGIGGTFATIGTPITNIATVSYADNSALAEGTYYFQVIAEDTAGNTATSATSSVLTVDKTAPVLQSFTSSNANSDPDDPLTMYGTGDTINIQAVFNENLASGSTMTIELENTAGSQVVLNQISGSTLYGTYTVSGPHDGISDDSIDLAVRRVVSMGVSDLATNLKSSESVPAGQNLSDNKDIIVDTVPPSLQSFSATAGNYNAGDSITLTAHYNKSVKAGSNIHVKVNSDGGTATIDMTTVSTSTISGPYVVQSGDNVQNLKVASIVSQAVSDIKNNQLTDTIMPSTNISDGVLVDTTAPVITFTNDVDSGPTQSDEVTINVSEINPSSHKYIFSADNVCNTKNYTSATSFGSDTPITFIAETNNTKYICTKSVDTAGNESYAASANPLNIDITHPTGTILINRSLNSGQIQLTAADGSRAITGLQMRSVIYDNDTSACDLSAASWGDFADILDLTSSSGFVKACVEYRDVAGNTTIISATPPQTPQSFQYYDVSDPDDFRIFLSWKIPTGHEGSKGFYQYQIFQCSDAKANADCTINTAGAPDLTINQESTNYKNYLGLSNDNKYCYQVRFASHDADGTDYSEFSDKKCVVPSSGGSSVTKDVAIQFPADPVPDAEIFANQVTIHWDTVNANDPSELLPADSQVCWRVHLPEPPGWNCRSYESYETSHIVTISKATNQIYDLVPDTEYEYQVHSETSWGKEATLDGPATFTTKNGPVIKNINADPIGNSTATVRWTTENKDGDDLASSSSLWYASALDSNDNLVTPTEAACDSADVVSHTCTLSDLSIGTQYYYYVESTANSATARDTANGAFYRFTTLSDSTPPVITANPDNPLITTDTQAAISWETNERATSWLLYDTANHAAFDNFTDTDFDPTIVLRNPYASYLSGDNSNLSHNFIMSLNSLEPSTTYYYRMVSQDTSKNVSVSQEYSFTTLPIQTDHPDLTNPGNPVVAEYSDTEAVIYLSAANTDSTSKICWDTEAIADMDNCADYSEINTATKSHFYHVTGLTPETVYHVMTKIIDSETPGINFTSSDVTFTTEKVQIDQHEPLSEIADVASPPSVITDTKAVITFDTDQVAQCSIEYGTETGNYSEVPFVESDFNVNHSIHMTGLIFSTAYFYQIACIDDLGNTEESDEYTFTTLDRQLGEGEYNALQDATAPSISGVSTKSITGESVTITWNTDEKANSLVSYMQENATVYMMGGDTEVNKTTDNYATSHSVTISNLVSNIKYVFSVFSIDVSGNIAQSSESSFTTKDASSISDINVVSKAMGQASITWKTGSKTSSIVDYGLTTAYGKTKQDSAQTKEHEITLTELTPGETYHFRVRGEDEEKNVFASSDVTFQPKSPPKISDFKIDAIYEHGATITFNTNVATDMIVTYTDADNPENSGFQGLPELTPKHEITLKNLASGATFAIKVKVRDEIGNETEENFSTFSTIKDEKPPQIDNVRTESALMQDDKVQSIITWKTDEQSTSTLIYREGKNGEEKEYKNSDSLSANHVVVITAFKSGTVYNFKVKSVDAAGNEAISEYFSFLTPKMQDNIIQVIIKNFTEIFGWTGNVGR